MLYLMVVLLHPRLLLGPWLMVALDSSQRLSLKAPSEQLWTKKKCKTCLSRAKAVRKWTKRQPGAGNVWQEHLSHLTSLDHAMLGAGTHEHRTYQIINDLASTTWCSPCLSWRFLPSCISSRELFQLKQLPLKTVFYIA